MKNIPESVQRLAHLPLFATTDPATLALWLEAQAPEPARFGAGERIDTPGERCLGILLHGRAEIHSADSGRSVILRELIAPGVFGAASLFCKDELPLSRIEAKTDCCVLCLSLAAVRDLLTRDEGFRDAYLAFLAERVSFLNRKILCFTAGSAERRLALWLISEEGDTIHLPATLSSLADMLNIGRASLYRAFDKLEGEGLICQNGRSITVLSRENILQKYQ